MPLNPKQRQDCNKAYYQANKQKALEKASIRVTCVCCDRIRFKNGLLAHMKTALCQRTKQTEYYINDRLHGITVEK